MNYTAEFINGGFNIKGLDYFSPDLIFDCGQCFRFDKTENGIFGGVAFGKYITVRTIGDNEYRICGFSQNEFPLLKDFFALDDDYKLMREDILSSMKKCGVDTSVMELAMEEGRGIRLLRQEPFECLCSFIISQNNNIPRIKKIISTLCNRFGNKFTYDGEEYFSFPTRDALLSAGEEAIFECKTGFRAKYIMDGARVADDEHIKNFKNLSDSELLEALMEVKGVGTKVSSCVALFGFGRISSFPVDVWVKRVMEKYYPAGTSPEVFGKYAGLAQQYLFYHERYMEKQNN